jgi:hypothetical protein
VCTAPDRAISIQNSAIEMHVDQGYVGRTGLEPVTDGLSRDYSPGARATVICSTDLDMIGDFSPILKPHLPDYSGHLGAARPGSDRINVG